MALAAVSATIAVAACESSSSGPASGCKPDIATIQSTIFAKKCATSGCHSSDRAASGLDLEAPGVESRLVDVAAACPGKALVASGNPGASVIVDKISNDKPTCGGSRMPIGGTLDGDDIACITSWINSLPGGPNSGTPDGTDGDGGGLIDSGPSVACGAGQTACGSACVDTKSDPKNCGACGKVCTEPFCIDGACSNVCTKTTCGSACVDTTVDANNCGACGTKCTGGKVCSNSACTCGTSVVTLSMVQQATFSPDCTGAGCHSKVGPKSAAEGLDLSSLDLSYQSLVGIASATCGGKTRVVGGDVANSYLFNKITGVGICNGSKMPKGASLSASQIDGIRNWICNGAQK
jgi:hypothetical protein